MSTTDTPKTDAEAVLASTGFGGDDYCERYVPSDFARTLERQNRELADALQLILMDIHNQRTAWHDTEFLRMAERRARAALTKAAL